MNSFYTYLALDLANERAREAADSRRLAQASNGRPSLPRRALATGLALVSRGSAAAARRLDAAIVVDHADGAYAAGK